MCTSRIMIVLALTWLCAGAAMGGVQRHAEATPGDVDVFVTLEGATLEDWGFLTGVAGAEPMGAEAWRELGEVLGMERDEAFRRLVGRRASIAARGVWAGEAEWVALLSTDGGAAKRFQKAFKATPRRIVGGRPVLALEGGRFQAAVLPQERGVLLALAPVSGGTGSLFEAVCAGGGATLAATERFEAVDRLDEAMRYAAVVRLPEAKGWLVGGALGLGDGIDIELLGRIEEPCEALATFEPEAWTAALDGSVFAVVERAGSLFSSGDEGALGPIAIMSPVLEAMGKGAGEVTAMVLEPRETGQMSIAAASTMAAVGERATELDAAASRTISRMSLAVGQGAWERDFLGLYPRAWRRAKINDRLEVTWVYLAGGEGAAGLDWFVGGTDEALAKRLALAAVGDGAARGVETAEALWRSVGEARPAELARWMLEQGRELPRPLEALSGVSRIAWAVRDLPGGGVEGSIHVRRADAEEAVPESP